MTVNAPDDYARDVEDARRDLDALEAPHTAYDVQEVVRCSRIYMGEGWERAQAFAYAARLVLGGRVEALPSLLAVPSVRVGSGVS
jgi:hypothetical protein